MKNADKMKASKSSGEWKKLMLELFVVFLGVTAGFLLNNWQMERRDKQLEQKYLDGFLEDITSNTDELKAAVRSDSLWQERVKPKLLQVKDGTLAADSASVLMKLVIGISKINFKKGTYEDITNSGNLNLVSSYDLKKQIVDYHVAIQGIEFIDNYFYQYFNDFVMPFVFDNYNVLEESLSRPETAGTTQFANLIAGYYAMVHQRRSAYEALLSRSLALKAAL